MRCLNTPLRGPVARRAHASPHPPRFLAVFFARSYPAVSGASTYASATLPGAGYCAGDVAGERGDRAASLPGRISETQAGRRHAECALPLGPRVRVPDSADRRRGGQGSTGLPRLACRKRCLLGVRGMSSSIEVRGIDGDRVLIDTTFSGLSKRRLMFQWSSRVPRSSPCETGRSPAPRFTARPRTPSKPPAFGVGDVEGERGAVRRFYEAGERSLDAYWKIPRSAQPRWRRGPRPGDRGGSRLPPPRSSTTPCPPPWRAAPPAGTSAGCEPGCVPERGSSVHLHGRRTGGPRRR